MWKLILVAIITFAIWAYFNPAIFNGQINNLENNTLKSIKQEKTINAVTGTRKELNTEAKNAINN